MAAFNINLGNKMVMQSARGQRGKRTFDEEEIRDTCGCLGKARGKSKKSEKERIKQFSIWFEEKDLARQKVFAKRRFEREFKREIKRRRVRCIRKLFIPTALCWIVGFGITLASTVRSLGEGTVFWNYREDFQIAGPCLLGAGLIMLMLTEGLISNQQIQIKQLEARDHEITIDVAREQIGQHTLQTIANKLPALQKPRGSVDKATETEPFFLTGKTNPQITLTRYHEGANEEELFDQSNTEACGLVKEEEEIVARENNNLLQGATSLDYDEETRS